jgi:hypothetical protein
MSGLEEILDGGNAPAVEKEELQPESQAAPEQHEEGEQPETGGDGQPMAPVTALTAERRKYKENLAAVERKLEQQNAQMQQLQQIMLAQRQAELTATQQKQEPEPDFWEDPAGFVQRREERLRQEFAKQRIAERDQQSRYMAEQAHGKEVVAEALNAIGGLQKQNPQAANALLQHFNNSPHPYGTMLEWHQRAQAMAEIGADPNAYREKLRAELKAELQQQQPSQGQGQAMDNLPSNFASGRNVGSRSGPEYGGPQSLTDIFGRR